VLALLATGGMAEIYLARGESAAGVERYVVLKRILREKATDASFVDMFLDEARLAAQLQHPNVAQVYDIGKLGESLFFTMEYVHGETLRTLLQRNVDVGGQVPLGCVLAIAQGAAAGLHHAHERNGVDGKPLGIVHRDVSPSNLMISFEGTVKLVDFGVAKATRRSQETRSGTVKGKISYLSPEQCQGLPLDRRSDLFSLGIVLWETITGQRLFKRDSDFDTMKAIVDSPAPPLRSVRPDVPIELDALVQKLLAKRMEDRYQSGDELHDDIDAIAVRAGVSMSASVLGRYLKEVFGSRPEPWVELAAAQEADTLDPNTQTGIPLDTVDLMPYEDPVEQALAQVIDLGAQRASGVVTPGMVPSAMKRPTALTMASAPGAFRTVKIDRRDSQRMTAARVAEGEVTSTPGSFQVVMSPAQSPAPWWNAASAAANALYGDGANGANAYGVPQARPMSQTMAAAQVPVGQMPAAMAAAPTPTPAAPMPMPMSRAPMPMPMSALAAGAQAPTTISQPPVPMPQAMSGAPVSGPGFRQSTPVISTIPGTPIGAPPMMGSSPYPVVARTAPSSSTPPPIGAISASGMRPAPMTPLVPPRSIGASSSSAATGAPPRSRMRIFVIAGVAIALVTIGIVVALSASSSRPG
jgi:serine/threonine protein kinase